MMRLCESQTSFLVTKLYFYASAAHPMGFLRHYVFNMSVNLCMCIRMKEEAFFDRLAIDFFCCKCSKLVFCGDRSVEEGERTLQDSSATDAQVFSSELLLCVLQLCCVYKLRQLLVFIRCALWWHGRVLNTCIWYAFEEFCIMYLGMTLCNMQWSDSANAYAPLYLWNKLPSSVTPLSSLSVSLTLLFLRKDCLTNRCPSFIHHP